MGTRAALVGLIALGTLGTLGTLGACGDDDLAPYWGSGSRLQARVYVTDDGYEGLVGWRDAVSGSECWAGESRSLCAAGFQRLWSDAACTTVVSQYEVTAPYVTAGDRAYRPTGAMSIGPVYWSGGGQCHRLVEPEVEYWLLEEVPPETLVSWVIEPLDADGRVMKKTTGDGAFEHVVDGGEQRHGGGDARLRPILDVVGVWHDENGVWDAQIDLPCTIGPVDGTDQLACLPTVVQPQPYHRNATCTDAAVLLSAGDMGLAGSDVYDRRVTGPIWTGFSPDTCAQMPAEALLYERTRSVADFHPAAVHLELR